MAREPQRKVVAHSMAALGLGHLMLTPSANTLIDATSREI